MAEISIVMSVFDGDENYLSDAITSILNQSYTNYEFIIVDDGSNKKTKDILAYFKNTDSRIKLLTNPINYGLTKSLNLGIKEARGKYIARMDSDDFSYKDRLRIQYEFMENNQHYAMVGTAFEMLVNDKIVKQRIPLIKEDEEIKKGIMKFNPFCHATVMVKKTIMEKVGYYDERYKYSQDYDLWLRIVEKYKVANIPEPLLLRRMGNSISFLNEKEQIMSSVKARISALKRGEYPFHNLLFLLRPIIVAYSPKTIKSLFRLF